MGDTLGLDLYVVTRSTPLDVVTASTRIVWKEDTLDYWHAQAESHGRALWITEMQGAAWPGLNNFTTSDLRYSEAFSTAEAHRCAISCASSTSSGV